MPNSGIVAAKSLLNLSTGTAHSESMLATIPLWGPLESTCPAPPLPFSAAPLFSREALKKGDWCVSHIAFRHLISMLVDSIFTSLSMHSITPTAWKEPLAGRDHLSSCSRQRQWVKVCMNCPQSERQEDYLYFLFLRKTKQK